MDNSIEKINRHSTFGNVTITKGDEDWSSEEEGVKVTLQPLTDEYNKNRQHVNVGTPGHIDHGNNSTIQELSPGTYEINAGERRSAKMADYQPEEIEYEFDDWKKAKPMLWNCDAKNGGKKRDKVKAKAQKKARKLTRRK